MSNNVIHGVNLEDYAAAMGVMSNGSMDVQEILNRLNINSEQWAEVCTSYQFAAMTDMGTYMKFLSNPSLSSKFGTGAPAETDSQSVNSNAGTAESFLSSFTNNPLFNSFGFGTASAQNDDVELAPAEKMPLLNFGAIILRQHNVKSLKLYGTQKDLKSMLENMWDITDKKSAIETLEWLKTDGDRADANALDTEDEEIQEAIQDYSEILEAPVKLNIDADGNVQNVDAWDIERMASTSRYSFGAGYISEDECYQYLETAMNMAIKTYRGWAEYASAFMTGRALFFGSDPSAFMSAIEEMLEEKDSIWNENPLNWKN